ncbi:PAS domain-containing protein [bacterium]|nr:PAS domain-containing protein [candidate division CSSED10-310 bacterium]
MDREEKSNALAKSTISKEGSSRSDASTPVSPIRAPFEVSVFDILKNLRDVVYAVDTAGVVTFVSSSTNDLLGLTPASIIGKPFLQFIHPDDHRRIQVNFRKLLDGQNQLNEYRLKVDSHPDVWVLISSKPLRHDGRIMGVCGILTDITQRRDAMDSIIRKSRFNAEIARLGRIILSTETIETISTHVLMLALELTGSRVGWLAYLDLETKKIVTITRTCDGVFPSGSEGKQGGTGAAAEFHEWLSTQGMPVMVNTNDASGIGLLPGEFGLVRCFLSVPALIGGEPTGWIAVADKLHDYTPDDVRVLEQFVSLFIIAANQRMSKRSLMHSEEMYRTTIDNLDAMVHVVDRDFNLVLYNRRVAENAARYAGLGGSFLGRSLFDTFPFLTSEIRNAYVQVRETGQSNRTLDVTEVRDEVLYTDAWRIPIHDNRNEVDRIITILRDVTEFKEVENTLTRMADELEHRVHERTAELEAKNAALEEEIERHRRTAHALDLSQELTNSLMNTPYIIALLLEKNGDIVACNEVAAKSLGSTAAQLMNRNITDVLNEESLIYRRDMAYQMFSEKKIIQFQDQRKGRWFDTTLLPVLDMDGELQRIAVIARDITDQKRMDEELLKNQKLESIGVLAGGIAHDFNNYLTGILGYITMLRLKTGIPADSRYLLENAEKAILEARLLAQQLLTFSKGGQPVRKGVDLRDIIRESVAFSIRGSHVQCCLTMQDEPMYAHVDTGQIWQVIQNLILNSIHAVSNGGYIGVQCDTRHVPAAVEPTLVPGFYHVIEVSDNGCGIEPEHLSRVFDPYYTTKPNGSGLGLAASHSIISNHHGAITVRSNPGQGAVFTVYLPLSDQHVSDDIRVSVSQYQGSGKILVMDDEVYVRDVIDMMLKELGHDVVLASHGDEAIRIFQRAMEDGNGFQAVILDLTVPGGRGGAETLAAIRAIDPGIKAVVTSGYSIDSIMANYERYGFTDSLAKPFNFDDLSRVMKRILE